MYRILLPAALAVAPMSPYALGHERPWPHCEVESHLTLLDTKVLGYDGDCILTTPLALATQSRGYPLMPGKSFTVEYWEGAWSRSEEVQNSYRQDFVDPCTGAVVGTGFLTDPPHTEQRQFAVDNPNLHDDVSKSYDLVPMTDQEAAAALAQEKMACETAGHP